MSQPCKYPISVMLTARDARALCSFYRDTLGFTLDEAWPDKDNPMWASLTLDGQTVMIGQLMDPAQAGDMCGGDAGAKAYMETLHREFGANQKGVGICTYVAVPDIDAWHKAVTARGLRLPAPKNQFYGLREVPLQDPEGYRFMFYTLIRMSSCQSCGMPLADAQPGQMYCSYCTDEHGQLRPWEQVLEGTTVGYFMQMQKLPRDKAEAAAREHLAKMPAWASRGGLAVK